MFKKLIGFLSLCLFFTLPLATSAQPSRGNVFSVDASVHANGVLIGRPQFSLTAGSEAVVAASDGRGYALRVTVDDDKSRASVPDPIKLNAKLYFADRGRWVLVSAPEIQGTTGSAVRQSSTSPTIYGDGGYTVEFRVSRTDRVVTPAEFAPIEDCPLWKSLASDGPLEGVRVKGALTPTASTQTAPEVPEGDLPYCCTSGNMRCCSSVPGTCCRDGMTGNNCCT